MRQLNFRYVSAVLALCAGIASGVLVAVSPVCAASIEVEGAQSWQAQIDEQQRHATIIETIGPGPGPVLKKFLNVNAAGVWSTTVIATNNSGRTWVDYHFDILFPPPQPSVPGDGIDFNNPQVGPGLPCASVGLLPVCVGTWMITPDSLWVQFNQGQPQSVVMPGQTVSMVFDFTIASPPVNLPVNFTLSQHYSVPEPSGLVLAAFSVAGLLGLRRCRAEVSTQH